MPLMAGKIMQIVEKGLEFYEKGVWTPYPRAPVENVKSMEFGNSVDLLSSSRRFDRVYQG